MDEVESKDAGSPSKDKLFDPSVDMLVNDFDDEQTLEEEEALAADEDASEEISSLQKEGDMPLEELLALYGVGKKLEESESVGEEDEQEEEPMEEQESEPDHPEPEPSQLQVLYEPIAENEQDASRLLRSVSRFSEEEEEDYDYMPSESDWRNKNKTIMVGNDYQAVIPEGLRRYDDALPYENEDKLLWDPKSINDLEVEEFLKKASALNRRCDTAPNRLRDDEQALFLLQQCGHNVEEALRRIRINVNPPADSMSLWSEEECRNFESGVGAYGKGFHRIQQNKVRTRSVGELVQFYYHWKKSERHDVFANKTRMEKKYSLHPDHTDFMDRFLEDQDGRDRSSSPNVQCSDNKKSTTVDNTQPIKDS